MFCKRDHANQPRKPTDRPVCWKVFLGHRDGIHHAAKVDGKLSQKGDKQGLSTAESEGKGM